MAKLLTLATAVAATGTVAQTGVETTAAPFAPGFNAIAEIDFTGVTGTPTVLIQTSPDNSTWTTVATLAVITRAVYKVEITLNKYIRANQTVAGSAGTYDAYVYE